MLAMAGALELQATSVDHSVLDALDYASWTPWTTRPGRPGLRVLDALDYVREFSMDGLRFVVPRADHQRWAHPRSAPLLALTCFSDVAESVDARIMARAGLHAPQHVHLTAGTCHR